MLNIFPARLVATEQSAQDSPQFTSPECKELMDVIQSQQTSSVVKQRLIARIMLRVGESFISEGS